MRSNDDFRNVARQIATKGATKAQMSKYGLRGLSILSRLGSIDFPRSFPPDSMHLWFENIIPDLVKHWRGKYRTSNADGSDADDEGSAIEASDSESEEEVHSSRNRPAKRRKKSYSQRKSQSQSQRPTQSQRQTQSQRPTQSQKGKKKATRRAKEPKVIATDDEYNIKLADWENMSKEIAESARNFPLMFGPLLRNFIGHIHELTAAEWELFTMVLGPVYLKGVLPDEDYEEFISLIEAIYISCDYIVTEEDILEMDQRIQRFSKYYERRYYRMEWARLKCCLPVFHQILHVPQALQWAGPMYAYSQWGMERLCGTFARMAKSRVSTNRNLSSTIEMLEQKNTVVYALDYEAPHSSDDDSDGNLRLSNFLVKRLKMSRPPDVPVVDSDTDVLLFRGPSQILLYLWL